MSDYVEITALIGAVVNAIVVDDDEIIFDTNKGKYKMYHDQDCCEYVRVEDIDGDLNRLIGNKIVNAYESINAGDDEDGYGTHTWTFYRIQDSEANGFTIRWLGESNGYYSESVEIVKLD